MVGVENLLGKSGHVNAKGYIRCCEKIGQFSGWGHRKINIYVYPTAVVSSTIGKNYAIGMHFVTWPENVVHFTFQNVLSSKFIFIPVIILFCREFRYLLLKSRKKPEGKN